jgi:hypothetical protein
MGSGLEGCHLGLLALAAAPGLAVRPIEVLEVGDLWIEMLVRFDHVCTL